MINTNHKGETIMKKTLIVLVIVLVLLALAVGGAALFFFNSPQYAMMTILKDVKADGLEGLEPHLTGDAAEIVEKVTSISGNPLFATILGLFVQNEYLDILKSELHNVNWNVEDILKSSKRAQVVLSFDYQGEITGSINISMIRTKDGWKIDGVNSPKIDGFNFDDLDLSILEKSLSKDTEISEDKGFSFGDISLPDFRNFHWKRSDGAA
jgi:hypothetical protein